MSEALNPLPEDVMALVEAERSAPGPAPEIAAKLLSRLSQSLDLDPEPDGGDGAAGDGSGSPPSEPGPSGPPPGTDLAGAGAGAAVSKSIVALAFVGGIGVGGTAVHLARPEPAPVIVTVPAPAPGPPVHAPLSPEPLAPEPPPTPGRPEAERTTAARKGKPRPTKKPTTTSARSSAEVALIDRARTALGRGRAGDAIAALREHEKKYRQGALVEEREALMALSLLADGRHEEAQRRARAFQERYPKSLFRPLIQQSFAD